MGVCIYYFVFRKKKIKKDEGSSMERIKSFDDEINNNNDVDSNEGDIIYDKADDDEESDNSFDGDICSKDTKRSKTKFERTQYKNIMNENEVEMQSISDD